MKFSLLSSLIIVAATALLAAFQGKRISVLKSERTVLETRALSLGLPLEGQQAGKSGNAAAGTKGTSRSGPSANHQETAQQFATELFAMVRKMNEMQKSGKQPTIEEQQDMMAFFLRFLELDPEVIPHIIAKLRNNDEFNEEEKRNIIGMSFMALGQSDPEKALDLFLNSSDLLEERSAGHMLGMALAKWAAKDPAAALDWIDLHEAKLPEKSGRDARKLAIASSFQSDPTRGIQMALELERDDLMQLTQQVSSMMKTPENQLDLLRNFEGMLGELPSDPSQISENFIQTASKDQLLRGGLLMGLGGTLANQPFLSASAFLESADLDPVETIAVARGIADRAHSLQDPGSWINWLNDNSLERDRENTITNVVRNWTNNDFGATAAWIGEQPPGPLREQATRSFAQTVAPHEPASAAEWALTLPESQQRTDLLRQIHGHWQSKDPGDAAAFAAQQGFGDPNPAPDPPPESGDQPQP